MSKETLHALIDENIYENLEGDISGEVLNEVLNEMVDEMPEGTGTDVEANPEGEASEDLDKLKVGEKIYNVPQTDTSNLATKQELTQGLSDKMDKPSGTPTAGNFAVFDSNGGVEDSGKKASDFATAAQGTKADNAIPMPSSGSNGQVLKKTTNGTEWADEATELPNITGNANKVLKVNSGATTVEWADESGGQQVQIGEFKFEAYDSDVANDLTAIGDTTTEDINGLTASADTLTTIVLMPNNDPVNGTGAPTATMMIATEETTPATTPKTYEFVYIGDLQEAITPSYTFSSRFQNALIALLQNVAFTSGDAATLLSNLEVSMSNHGELVALSATYTPTHPIYALIDTVEDMRDDLVVKAVYEDGFQEEISGYELTGSTDTAGTKNITVSYLGVTTTFQATVQWKMSFSLGDGSLTMLGMSVQNNGSYGSHSAEVCYLYENPETTAPRKCFVMEKGRVGLKYATVTNATQSDMSDSQYYMIPIPATATKVTVAITPNSQYFGANLVTVQDGLYIKGITFGGWQQGSHVQSLTAGQYSYIIVQSKYDSAGASYPTPPSELTITFE